MNGETNQENQQRKKIKNIKALFQKVARLIGMNKNKKSTFLSSLSFFLSFSLLGIWKKVEREEERRSKQQQTDTSTEPLKEETQAVQQKYRHTHSLSPLLSSLSFLSFSSSFSVSLSIFTPLPGVSLLLLENEGRGPLCRYTGSPHREILFSHPFSSLHRSFQERTRREAQNSLGHLTSPKKERKTCEKEIGTREIKKRGVVDF